MLVSDIWDMSKCLYSEPYTVSFLHSPWPLMWFLNGFVSGFLRLSLSTSSNGYLLWLCNNTSVGMAVNVPVMACESVFLACANLFVLQCGST